MLSHFPMYIGSHFCVQLVSSSFNGPFLFDDDVLSAALTASREDSAVSANIAVTKRFRLLPLGLVSQIGRPPPIGLPMPPLPLLLRGAT